jgi:predicted ATPase
MYIQKAEIKNIRSITDFKIKFKNPAGWHVLIGDNGAGKSTIIRSMALVLVGHEQSQGLLTNWQEWLKQNEKFGLIRLEGQPPKSRSHLPFPVSEQFVKEGHITKYDNGIMIFSVNDPQSPQTYENWFSAAFGPYRRFEGGDSKWQKVFENPSYNKLASHLSVFDESVALTEPITWLRNLNYESLENNFDSKNILNNLKKLINSEDKDGSFLQHNAKLESISSDGVFFKDGNGVIISVNQMSDGYRSILSMTFELIRQLVRAYGSESVFKNIEQGEMFIDLPGVVLVDEIDAHLHPTWQTRIGQWFLKYFPKLQFIVTTHSPLVCRAAEHGSIWRLAAPGSDEKSGEITGVDRDRLIYGNILDAYGTGVFGENTSISEDSNEMLNRLSELNVKSMMGLISDKENNELQKLRTKSPTEDTQKRTSEWLVEKFEKLENYLNEKETGFTKQEEESRTEYQKSRILLAQEWKNLKAILGMSKADLDKEKEK